jgi:hypothetical protein
VWHWCSSLLAMVQLSLSLFLTSTLPPLNFYNVVAFFLYEKKLQYFSVSSHIIQVVAHFFHLNMHITEEDTVQL